MQEQIAEIEKMSSNEAEKMMERLYKYSSSSEARTDLIAACRKRIKKADVAAAIVVTADFK